MGCYRPAWLIKRHTRHDTDEGVCCARLGGGFKENDQVEYVRHDSDEEMYDSFGRLKKKFRHRKDELARASAQASVPVGYGVAG